MHKHKTEAIHCTICTKTVPDDRILRQAVTCSKACANTLRNIRRRKRDLKKCRYCNAPSTIEERKLFGQWRASLGTKRKPGRPKKLPVPPEGQAQFTEMIAVY